MLGKKGITKTILGKVAVAMLVLILASSLAGAYSNPLSVPFKSQIPPGDSNSQNCGQASSFMVFAYYDKLTDGITPTDAQGIQGILNIDAWLSAKYGVSLNNGNGQKSSTTQLARLAREYGGRYGGFPSSYDTSGWTIERVKQEIDSGHPVIVFINSAYLARTTRGYNYAGPHFVVVKGYTSINIITNDPGTSGGNGNSYLNSEFKAAMNAYGGQVTVVIPNPITVVSPNNGEYWPRGSAQTVKWSFENNAATGFSGPPGTTVRIDLIKGTSVVKTIVSSVSIGSSGKGSYVLPWTWSAGLAAGCDYKIKVTTNYGYSDTSDWPFVVG